MMSDASIPVMKKPADMMEVGPNGDRLDQQAMQRHPVEELQRLRASQRVSFVGTNEEQEVRRLYGTGFAMRLATERKMATEMGSRGVSGIPSSGLMADILSGNDTKINFEDFLNLPESRPVFSRSENPHSALEHQLGM